METLVPYIRTYVHTYLGRGCSFKMEKLGKSLPNVLVKSLYYLTLIKTQLLFGPAIMPH